MVAMMVPTTAHTTLFYARLLRGRDGAASIAAPAALFVAGYVATWTLFSASATALQLGLELAAVMSPAATKLDSPNAGGIELFFAGAFQWTPWKSSCLRRCRSPLGFFLTGARDALARYAWASTTACLGCCPAHAAPHRRGHDEPAVDRRADRPGSGSRKPRRAASCSHACPGCSCRRRGLDQCPRSVMAWPGHRRAGRRRTTIRFVLFLGSAASSRSDGSTPIRRPGMDATPASGG
jgi:hypothetical protein